MTDHPDLTPILRGAELPSAARQELLAHLQGCPVCRAALAQDDPSALFALLALEPVPDTVLARVSRGVADGIAREARRVSTRRVTALCVLAASLLLAAFLGVNLLTRNGVPTGPPIPGKLVEVDLQQASEPKIVLPAGFFEVLDTPGSADVVNISVEEVDLVMIFDEELGI